MHIWKDYFNAFVVTGFGKKFWFFLKTFLNISPIPKVLISLCILSFVLYIIRSKLL